MQTEVNESGRFERTLTVRLENEELAQAKQRAARKISKSMKIKGFRPGKAPLGVVERMAGADYVRSEAIEEAIQDVVPAAIDEAGLEPVTVPSVSAIRDDNEDGTVEIDVLVTLWPILESLPDFDDFEIEVEDPAVTQEEVDQQLDALRNQFAELEDHDGALDVGDFAMIDIAVTQEGESIESASAKDLMYEVGSGSFIPELDEMLDGAEVGATVTGDATLPEGYSEKGGEDVTLTVEITEGRRKVLPELTDEMVSEATEFDTEEDLVDAIERNMLAYKVHTQRSVLRDKAVQYALNEVDLEVPEALVNAELEARVRNLITRLEGDNIDIQDYLRIVGQDEATFIASMRDQAENALSTRILLESIAAVENWEVSDDDMIEHVETLLQGQEGDPQELIEAWKASGQIESLTGDILRERALESLVEAATPVDADGNPVDLTPVEIADEDTKTAADDEPEAEESEEPSGDGADAEPEE
ncbi:MAG: trigger factor [Acidimicrobiia bacterium]|nr:trigger factor [Acidimicrobiia bacterium]